MNSIEYIFKSRLSRRVTMIDIQKSNSCPTLQPLYVNYLVKCLKLSTKNQTEMNELQKKTLCYDMEKRQCSKLAFHKLPEFVALIQMLSFAIASTSNVKSNNWRFFFFFVMLANAKQLILFCIGFFSAIH